MWKEGNFDETGRKTKEKGRKVKKRKMGKKISKRRGRGRRWNKETSGR